ncbi:IQ domain-containing protein M [Perognathus longimembris pacificus]|uniref:IQ domain-containing protein M n=1 Tax=Perognathus longimembris pacificus TaxID=214514 RepID=UPI0020186E7E|nr:IQ domain-containing protein M [Perognathus longimembris pacificus]
MQWNSVGPSVALEKAAACCCSQEVDAERRGGREASWESSWLGRARLRRASSRGDNPSEQCEGLGVPGSGRSPLSLFVMAVVQAVTQAPFPKDQCRKIQIPRQDFFHEAKFLIAQHYKKISENKVQSTSVDVFKDKYPKSHFVTYIPSKITKTQTPDVIQEHREVLRTICFPQNLPQKGHSKEPSQQTQPCGFNIKERYQTVDFFTKEQVTLDKIMTAIESVSKKMQKEKQQLPGKPRGLESSHALATCPSVFLQPVTSAEGTQRETVETTVFDVIGLFLCDVENKLGREWVPNLVIGIPHCHLHTLHSRITDILSSLQASCYQLGLASLKEFHRGWYMIGEELCQRVLGICVKVGKSLNRQQRFRIIRLKVLGARTDRLDSKVKRIGPHIEIFQVFRGSNKPVITKKVVQMIVGVQAAARGWLERKRLQRISTKALYHGPDLKSVIDMYRRLIHRVRHQLGLWRTRQIINYLELEEWMDRKKFYETMFAKREDWQGLQKSELLKYFNDCGHFPTQKQIDYYWEQFHNYKPGKQSDTIPRSHVIEMLFTIYPPVGAHAQANIRLKSTWLRPIVNGEEGYRYIVSGHPILKRANIRVVGKLVARSLRERKMRQS